MGINIENHNSTVHRVIDLGTLSPKWEFPSNPSPQAAGKYSEEEAGRL